MFPTSKVKVLDEVVQCSIKDPITILQFSNTKLTKNIFKLNNHKTESSFIYSIHGKMGQQTYKWTTPISLIKK